MRCPWRRLLYSPATMDWVYYSILLVLLVAGLGIQTLALPGLWLMLASTAGYAWLTGFHYVGLWTLLILLGLVLTAELIEFLAGSAGAKSAGGTKRSMAGAIVGGILGGIFLSVLIPIPLVGTIVGVCLGAFAGSAGTELLIHGDADKSRRVGFGAAKGALVGILTKLTFGVIILGIVAWRALPLGGRPAPVAAPLPATAPATLPTTVPATSPATQPA